MTIIKRADLGRPLTWDELDDNFQQVDDLTTAASAAVSGASAAAAAAASSASASANSATDAANSAANAVAAIVSAVKSTITFTTGGTLNSNLDRISDGTYLYYWTGAYPVTVPAGSTVAGTGGIAVGFWAVDNDQILRNNLSSSAGLTYLGFCTDYDEVRAVEPTDDGQAVFLKLTNIVGLIEYVYDSSDLTSADDGGSVLVTAGSKRWKLSRTIRNGIDNYGLSFNPSAVEVLTNAYAALNAAGKPYAGLTNEKYPGRGAKFWRETQGTLENAVIHSIRNATSPTIDPPIPVLGVDSFSTRASYSNRDHVGSYIGMDSQSPIVTTSNTTFTSTTVTSSDFAAALASGRLKVGVLIDTTDSPKKTGKVTSLNKTTNTLTVDGWVTAGGGGATATPSDGTGVKVNPMTGLWCANWILGLDAAHDVSTAAYIMEGDIRNNKAAGAGHGMYMRCADSSYRCGNAFWAVGGASASWNIGYAAQYCSTAFYADTSNPVAFWSHNAPTALRILGATTSISIGTSTTTYTSVDGLGTISGLRYKITTYAANSTVDALSVICVGPTVTSQTVINLPEPTAARELGRILILKNPAGSTANILWAGGVEGGSGSISTAPGACLTLYCNGVLWIPLSRNTAAAATTTVAGSGTAMAASVVVSHGLGSIPSAVLITLTGSYSGNFWVTNKTASAFTLNFSAAPTSLTFDWLVRS